MPGKKALRSIPDRLINVHPDHLREAAALPAGLGSAPPQHLVVNI